MKLSQHDLQQLDEGILQGLPEAVLRRLSVNLLADLKEARELLQQHPGNSSRPPSSRVPWERGSSGQDAAAREARADADGLPEGDDVTAADRMGDGWFSYRDYPRRLRCWAHLLRKAQGLIESYDRDALHFGIQVRGTLEDLMAAIYAARAGPPPEVALREAHTEVLQRRRQARSAQFGHRHEKTRALATEFLNDGDAIFRVLEHPALALTNNAAEQALRHWVISRRISHGTHTAVVSGVFALLASVIDTCRQRGHSS